MASFLISAANLILLFFLAYTFWKRETGTLRLVFWPALLFRLMCGILLGMLYTYYYSSGDTFGFFNDGVTIAQLARDDVKEYLHFLWDSESATLTGVVNYSQHRALFFAKAISVVNLVTFDRYWLTSLYFSFVSFIGAWHVVKVIDRVFPNATWAAILSFLFFPSVVFWSSGVIKESLAIPALFFMAGIFIKRWSHRRLTWLEWIVLPLATWCVWRLKYFYLALFLPLACTTLLVRFVTRSIFKTSNIMIEVALWLGCFVCGLLLVSYLHPNFDFSYLPEVVVMNNVDYTRISDPGNVVRFKNLNPDFASLLFHSPKALVSGLFRPTLWEVDSVIKLLAALENTVLAVLVLLSVRRVSRIFRSEYWPITFATLAYCCFLCILLTLSTPNLGTLVRYRIGFLPFLVFVLLYGNPVVANGVMKIQSFFVRRMQK